MPEKLKSLWLCHSGVGRSETFLEQSLELMRELTQTTALCGAPPLGDSNPHAHYGQFSIKPMRLHHTVIRKLTGKDILLESKRKRCQKEMTLVLKGEDVDFVWIEFATTGWLAKRALEDLGVPYFINVHGYDITRAFASQAYKSGFVDMANQSAGVICASHHTRMLCQSAGVRSDRLHVIRLGIDERMFPAAEEKTAEPSFVHFGRLTGKKGPLISLEAFALVHQRYPQSTMTFIGSGPLEAELKRRIAHKQLGNAVSMLPAHKWQDGLREVSRHWVFCQHSITHIDGDQEGFALSPAEAAVMGMPIVSTYHNGIPEHVMDGVSGFLVREHDFESMAERMIRLIENEALRMEMGRAGRKNVLVLCDQNQRKEQIRLLIAQSMSAVDRGAS